MDKKVNYIIIGDSIIYGIGDYETNGWPAMFKNYIVRKDDSKDCSNFVHIVGFPGATSSTILDKIDSILKTFKDEDIINTVILSIGVNDTQEFNGSYKNTIDQFKENMNLIIKKIQENNCNLVIIGLTRIQCGERFYWKPNKYYDNTVISEYEKDLKLIISCDNELPKLCENNSITYIPMKDILYKEDYIDGLHPTTIGHRKMFNEVIEKLKI